MVLALLADNISDLILRECLIGTSLMNSTNSKVQTNEANGSLLTSPSNADVVDALRHETKAGGDCLVG